MTEEDRDLIAAYLYGELDEVESEAFEARVEADEALAEELEAQACLLEGFRDAQLEETPPPGLARPALNAAARREEAPRRKWFSWLRGPLPGFAAAGAVAVALFAVGNVWTTLSPVRSSEPAAQADLAKEKGRAAVREAVPSAAEAYASVDDESLGAGPSEAPPADNLALEERPAPSKLAFGDGAASGGGRSASGSADRFAARKRPAPAPARRRSKGEARDFAAESAPNDIQGVANSQGSAARRALSRSDRRQIAEAPTPQKPRAEPEPESEAMLDASLSEDGRLAQREGRGGGGASLGEAKDKASEAPGFGGLAGMNDLPKADEEAADPNAGRQAEAGQLLVQAAMQAKARGRIAEARASLARAAARVYKLPMLGEVLFLRAQLELEDGQFVDARDFARRAARVPGFRQADDARVLARRAARRAAEGTH